MIANQYRSVHLLLGLTALVAGDQIVEGMSGQVRNATKKRNSCELVSSSLNSV
jgi:hypothetical protein